MGQSLPPSQLELYRCTDEILFYIWDPIGIGGVPEARDEYHGYLPHVFSLLLEGKEKDIRDYLLNVISDTMGLNLDQYQYERTDRAVDLLHRWRELLIPESKGIS